LTDRYSSQFRYHRRHFVINERLITFRVNRRRREMYSSHARLSVSVCLSGAVCPRPYAHTTARTRMQLGEWCQLCTIGRICNRCTGCVAVAAAQTRNVSECLYSLYASYFHCHHCQSWRSFGPRFHARCTPPILAMHRMLVRIK